MHPTTGYTAPYGHECQSSGAPVRGSPGGQTQNRGRRPLGRGEPLERPRRPPGHAGGSVVIIALVAAGVLGPHAAESKG